MAERPKSDAFLAAQLLRSQLMTRLESENEDDLVSQLAKCGQSLTLVCTNCGFAHEVETRCRRRWCPVCARALAARVSCKYAAAVARIQWPLFVTLTAKNWDSLETEPLRHMRRCFGKLRRQKWFRGKVRGGVAGIEITNIGNGWHPHLHAVMDCRWLSVTSPAPKHFDSHKALERKFLQARTEVNEVWSQLLGREGTIKTKRAYSSERDIKDGKSKPITTEVLKYAVKGSDLIECPEPIGDLIRSMQATRLITSWGTLFGKLRYKDIEEDAPQRGLCEQCGQRSWMPSDTVDRIIRNRNK